MAVKIRLKRMGKKHQPFYRIVVADSRAPRDGRSIESIGHYNPLPTAEELVIKEDRLFHWLSEGATPSDTVKSLLRKRGLTLKYELVARNADEATIKKEMGKWELAQDERVKRSAAAAEEKAKAEAKAAREAEKAAEAEAAAEAAEAEAAAAPAEDESSGEETVEEAAAPEAEAETTEPEAEKEAEAS